MNAVFEVMQNCENFGVKVSVSGENLKIDAPKGLPDSIKTALRQHKADIIRALARPTETAAPTVKQTPNAQTITNRLNRMIAGGVSFEVGGDDFEAIAATESEGKYLHDNSVSVLCTLQQVWLAECLFKHSPALLEDFTVEVVERSAIMTDGAAVEPCFEAVREVTAVWFNEQIAKL